MLGAIALLGLVTWAGGDADFRMSPVPNGALLAALPMDASAWRLRGDAGTLMAPNDGDGLVLSNPDGERVVATLAMPLALPSAKGGERRTLRLRGRFERLGPASFSLDDARRTRLFLRWFDAAGERQGYGAVVRFAGQFRTRRFERVTEVPDGVTRAEFVMVADRAGAWRFDDVNVDRVEPAPYYPAVLVALALAWTVAIVWLFATMLRGASRSLVGVLGGVLAVLVAGVALAQSRMEVLLEPVTATLATRLPDALVPSAQTLLKGGHAAGFGLLALLLVVLRRALGLSTVGAVALGLSLAFASEALQRHRPNRSADLGDVGIDAMGMAVALALWFAGSALARRRARTASVTREVTDR